MKNENQDFVKTRTKEKALSSYGNYNNNNVPQYLSKGKFLVWENLCKNKDIVFHISDNDNSVVIFDKTDYLDKIRNVLSDVRKLEKNNLKNGAILSHDHEKRVDNIIKKFVAFYSISEETWRSRKSVGT